MESYILPKPREQFSLLAVIVCVLFTFIRESSSVSSNASLKELQHNLKQHCCRFNVPSRSTRLNTSDCKSLAIQLEERLNRIAFTRTRTFKYSKKLWRSMSVVTRRHEMLKDTSVFSWRVNASRAESAVNRTITFKTHRFAENNSSDENVLSRVEVLIPFYYTAPPTVCSRSHKSRRQRAFISYRNNTFIEEKKGGVVAHDNIMVFVIPPESVVSDDSDKIIIRVNTDQDLMVAHLKGAVIANYYNMNETVIEEVRKADRDRALAKAKKSFNGVKKETSEILVTPDNEKRNTSEFRRAKRSSRKSKGRQDNIFCKVHDYIVDIKTDLNLRTIIVRPRKMNIGMCSGKCNAIRLSSASHYMSGRSILLNYLVEAPDSHDTLLSPGCVPDKMKSQTVLLYDMNGTGIMDQTLYVVPAAKIASCRCV